MAAYLKRRTRRSGLGTVEMALLMPLLLLLTFGAIEYGWMFLKTQQLTSATRNGARNAIRPDASTASIRAAVDSQMALSGMGASGYTVSTTPSDVRTAKSGDLITVSVVVAYSNVDVKMPLVPVPSQLRAAVTMAKEGP